MNSEDSGVIDLFAIHNRATAVPGQSVAPPGVFSVAPPDVFSAPPPAFTTDVESTGELDVLGDEPNPFAKPSRKKLAMIAGALGAFVFLGILVASLSGGGSEPARTAAAAKVESAPPPPPAATMAPPPAVVATVEPAAATPAAATPKPPTTGAAATRKAPARRVGPARGTPTKSRTTAGGVKLTKVQSSGIASP